MLLKLLRGQIIAPDPMDLLERPKQFTCRGPLVSVIIPTYNLALNVVEAVESALKQDYLAREILVIDDGSSDDTVDRLAPLDNQIRYIYQNNQGVAAARNRGIEEARGELIAFLDSDDLWHPSKLGMQVEFLENHPDIGLLHTDFWTVREGMAHGGKSQKELIPFIRTAVNVFQNPYLNSSTVMVRRWVVEQVGMFDVTLKTAEDVDFWMRVATEFPIGYLARVLVTTRIRTDGISNDLRSYEDLLRVYDSYVRKHPRFFDENRMLVRSVFANVLVEYGEDLLWHGKLQWARPVLMRSLQWKPSRKAWLLLLKSFVPASGLILLKGLLGREDKGKEKIFARQKGDRTGGLVTGNPRSRRDCQ